MAHTPPSNAATSHIDDVTAGAAARAELLARLSSECSDDPSTLARLSASRERLFRDLQAAPGGIASLVALRRDLLNGLRDHPAWAPIESDLTEALRSAFDPSRLQFTRIDAGAPAPLLEKLIRYEAVHEIREWRELRRRLEADRRCYAFFHPDWPGEPLIFTEVALTRGLSADVQPLLDPGAPVLDARWFDSAIFYSISSCQPGLRGFAFGNALILRVVDALGAELPRLRTFATLSPIPGFRRWLSTLAAAADAPAAMAALVARVDQWEWAADPVASAELERELLPLCAFYLLHATHAGEPADPVARFHLGNGARLHRVNWMSDLSPAGIGRSAGVTANYVYRSSALLRRPPASGRRTPVNASRALEQLAGRAARTWSRRDPHTALPISA